MLLLLGFLSIIRKSEAVQGDFSSPPRFRTQPWKIESVFISIIAEILSNRQFGCASTCQPAMSFTDDSFENRKIHLCSKCRSEMKLNNEPVVQYALDCPDWGLLNQPVLSEDSPDCNYSDYFYDDRAGDQMAFLDYADDLDQRQFACTGSELSFHTPGTSESSSSQCSTYATSPSFATQDVSNSLV